MTTTAPTTEILADIEIAAGQITERLRTKSIDQVIAIGERTGWWTAELVDWVADGRQGPPPAVLLETSTSSSWSPPAETPVDPPEKHRLEELQDQLVDAGVVQADEVDAKPAQEEVLPAVEDDRAPVVMPGDGAVASSAYIAVLQARDFGVDHTYQRPLDEPRVRRMVQTWDPRMVGVLDVSDRGAGLSPRYAVINGQHRAAAAARVSPAGADVWMACNVHEGLSVADEAALMHELDRKTKKLSGFEQWRARSAAGDPIVADVEAVVRIHGLRIGAEPTDGVMRSYGSAEKLVKLGGRNLLDNTLGVLRAAYGDAASAYQAPLLMGVGQLIHRTGDALDAARLHRALAGTRPEHLRSTATTLREIDGGPLHELMSRAIAGAYNRTPGSGPRIAGDR